MVHKACNPRFNRFVVCVIPGAKNCLELIDTYQFLPRLRVAHYLVENRLGASEAVEHERAVIVTGENVITQLVGFVPMIRWQKFHREGQVAQGSLKGDYRLSPIGRLQIKVGKF